MTRLDNPPGGADRIGNFIAAAPPTKPFAPRDLALYTEIRAKRNRVLMAGAARKTGFYA